MFQAVKAICFFFYPIIIINDINTSASKCGHLHVFICVSRVLSDAPSRSMLIVWSHAKASQKSSLIAWNIAAIFHPPLDTIPSAPKRSHRWQYQEATVSAACAVLLIGRSQTGVNKQKLFGLDHFKDSGFATVSRYVQNPIWVFEVVHKELNRLKNTLLYF